MGFASRGGLLGFVRRLAPPAADTDADLLGRFVADADPAAFEAIVRRHGPMVLGICRRRLTSADADDAFQAVFVLLARDAKKIARRESLPGWLYRVAYLVALKAAGRAARRAAVPLLSDEAAMTDRPPDHRAEADELKAALDAELAALPDKFRGVVVLCLVEGRTNTEAAAALGVPVGTVDSRLSAARKKLQARLARRGFAAAVAGGIEAVVPKPASAGPAFHDMVSAAVGCALGADGVPIGVSELTHGVATMTTMSAKTIAGGLLALGLLGGTAAGVYLSAGQTPQADSKPAADKKPADPPKADPKPATAKDATPAAVGEAVLLTADSRQAFDVLDKPAGIDAELTAITARDLLAALAQKHKVGFRLDEDAFKSIGMANVQEQKPVIESAAGLTVRQLLLQAFVFSEEHVVKVRGGQVFVTLPATANNDVANATNPSATFVAEDKPLAEVLTLLRQQTGANVLLDSRAKAQAGQPVSGVFNDVRVFTVATLLGDMCDLQPVLIDNVIYLTTRENAARIIAEKEKVGDTSKPTTQPNKRQGGA